MKFFFEHSAQLGRPLYQAYADQALLLLRKIPQDKDALAPFGQFNTRFKITWGLDPVFTDDLNITNPDTRACYALMLRLADLWAAFEHLQRLLATEVPKDKYEKSKVDFYTDATLAAVGTPPITATFNQLLNTQVLHDPKWRQEIYFLLYYLAKNLDKGAAKTNTSEAEKRVKARQELEPRHIFSLAYGFRNLYIHQGVAAALGRSDSKLSYKVKRTLYQVLFDTLLLYSLQFGIIFCDRKLCPS